MKRNTTTNELNHIRPAYSLFIRPRLQNGEQVNAIYKLFQDSTGFVWAGTQYGLFRLDGTEARAFRSDPENPFTLPGKFVTAIGESHSGDLLVGTYDAGSFRFDPSLERFYPLDLQCVNNNDRVLRSTINTPDGRTWIGSLASLTEVDFKTGHLQKYFHPEVEDLNIIGANIFTALFPLDDRHLLVGTGSGAFLFDMQSGEFHHLPFYEPGVSDSRSHNIFAITKVGEEIVLATAYFLYRLNRDIGQLELIEPSLNDQRRDRHFRFTSLEADSIGERLWVGSVGGLLRYENKDDGWVEFPFDESDPSAPCGPQIQTLLRDRSGMLWAGGANGVALLDMRYNFRYHRIRSVSDSESIRVNGFVRDNKGRLWVGTHKGLYEYNEKTGDKKRHHLDTEDRPETKEGAIIRNIYMGEEFLWLATDVGLFQWDIDALCVRNAWFSHPMKGTPQTGQYVLGINVKGVREDRYGLVWSGSDGRGVQCFNPQTGLFRYYRVNPSELGALPDATMLTSLEDRSGRLWFAFVGCLGLYHRESDTFQSFHHNPDDPHSIDHNMTTALYQDSKGNVWVGTAAGLNRVKERADGSIRFLRCRGKNNLITGPILSITSHNDDLWIGTNNGILRVHEEANNFSVRIYNVSEGSSPISSAFYCAFQNEDGTLYFGGHDGFDSFHPDNLVPDTIPPPVVLTDVRLFNKPVRIIPASERKNKSFALEKASPLLDDITLSHKDSVITFRYATLHYRQADRIRYAYKLEGFDRNWIEAEGKTEATYTNLDAGEYTFRVHAMNSDGLRSQPPVALKVYVEPPPWQTWWAYSLYGAAGASALAAFTRWRISLRERELHERQRLQQAREEERESIRRQNAADFHDEAGTTLTRILFLTELVRRRGEGNKELEEMLEKIDKNTTRLAQGMRDFIWVLDPDKDTLLDTLQRIETTGESLFAHLDTSFSMRYNHQELRHATLELNQRRQTLMICKEALNNVARHARANTVLVEAFYNNLETTISISDDGCGFIQSVQSPGYGMKSMQNRASSMNAALLIESEPENGTIIRLKIPHLGN